jgi:hypothetical protein
MTNLHYEFRVSPHHYLEIVQAIRDAGGEVTADTMTLDGLTAGYLYLPGKIVLTFEPEAAGNNEKYPDWVDGKPAEPALVKLIEEHRGKPVAAVWPPVPPADAAGNQINPAYLPEPESVEEKRGFWGGFRKGE